MSLTLAEIGLTFLLLHQLFHFVHAQSYALFIYLFIYLLCFASKHHTIIALKKLGHHNSLTPITVGPLQNIKKNIEKLDLKN